ncbi:MAG: acetyltransferase [Tidjanibacter sp.]|nr:acetyltransferase [Tidjanibacter sp.]
MILYGASGHCKVIIDILEANGVPIDFIVDDNPQVLSLLGYEVRRNSGQYNEGIVAIGSCEIRKKIVSSIKVDKYQTAIHPSAIISPRAQIGEGSVVMHGAIIQSCAAVGNHCIINTGSSVDHDCQIGDFAHIAPHATLCGNVQVDEGGWVGAGATIIPGVKIGKWAVVGAGAVVIRDVPDRAVVAGVPAKVIKYKE